MSSQGPQSILVLYEPQTEAVANGVQVKAFYTATRPNDLALTSFAFFVYLPTDNIAQINNKAIAAVIADANAKTGLTYNVGQVKIPNLT